MELVYFVVVHLIICFIGPLVAIITSYVLVFRRIWRRQLLTEDVAPVVVPTSAANENGTMRATTTATATQQQLLHQSKMRALRMLAAVVAAFVITFLPLYVTFMRMKLANFAGPGSSWQFTIETESIWTAVIPLAQWLSSANSCVNPFLYHFLDPKFRSRFRQMLLLSRTNSLAATGTAAAATAPSQNRQLQQFTVPLAINSITTATNNAEEAAQIQISTV